LRNIYPETIRQYEERPNLFESPESIARHILQVKKSPSGVINEDSARANLNPAEMRSARAVGDLVGELEYAERVCGWNLNEAKEYVKEKLATTNVPSRSKHGFAIVLSKTDRRLNMPETEHFAGEIANTFNEDEEQGFMEKLKNRIPFMRGKGVEE
jgi:hypothetical protein